LVGTNCNNFFYNLIEGFLEKINIEDRDDRSVL